MAAAAAAAAAAGPRSPRVFFDISIGGVETGRIEMVLFPKDAPLTAENFRRLCVGDLDPTGKVVSFKGSIFHSVIPDFICHGGDFERGDGTGGGSSYGDKFPDVETSSQTHRSWVLTTAHAMPRLPKKHPAGVPYPYTCGSQFFICVKPAPCFDGQPQILGQPPPFGGSKHVVFGKVVSGHQVVNSMEKVGSRSGTTTEVIKIVDCDHTSIFYV